MLGHATAAISSRSAYVAIIELVRQQLDEIAEEEDHGSLLDPDAVERKLAAFSVRVIQTGRTN